MADYFAANQTSAWFTFAAAVSGVLWLICKAIESRIDAVAVRDLQRLERANELRHQQFWWTFCVLAADGQWPSVTRQISEREWALAAPGICRELGQ